METYQNSQGPVSEGWINIISSDRQLQKLYFTRGDRNSKLIGRVRSAVWGDVKEKPLNWEKWYRFFYMKKLAVGWVDLKYVLDPEQQTLKGLYNIRAQDHILTSALVKEAKADTSTTVADYLLDEISVRGSNTMNEEACTIYAELDKKMAAGWLLVALMLSTVAGVATGVGWNSANLGIDVGTCILAALSALQGVLLLWHM